LGRDDRLKVADAMISLHPEEIALSGGEPLALPGIFEVAERISNAGIAVLIYTSGWSLKPEMLEPIGSFVTRVHVSLDGVTAEVHDRMRGRKGSFDRVMAALGLLDQASQDRRARGDAPLSFGTDCVVTQSNRHQIEAYGTDIAPRFPDLSFLAFGAVLPDGLASRIDYADHELLTDEQASGLVDPDFVARLTATAPPGVRVTTEDNRDFHPYLRGERPVSFMLVEPDGDVRAMPIYEGTVGSLLTDPPEMLWGRGVERWNDPFVREAFASVRTTREWAAACRRIDYHFGSDAVKAMLDNRAAYIPK